MVIEVDPSLRGSAPDIEQYRFRDGEWQKGSGPVPQEMELTLYVNGEELVTMLCTPTKLPALAYGFLLSEGLIARTSDVIKMRVCMDESLLDVRLAGEFKRPEKRTIGAGCGGGVTFNKKLAKVTSDLRVSPEHILTLMKQLSERATLYRYCGGVHTSALCDNEGIVVLAEDIGRHNTLDKIVGECLQAGIPTEDKLLLTTGRLSSEMMSKAAVMKTPVVFSRSSPTDRSIALARELGITLVGYVRASRLTVYSHQERLQSL